MGFTVSPLIAVEASIADQDDQAVHAAIKARALGLVRDLGLVLATETLRADFLLRVAADGLSFCAAGKNAPGPVSVNFDSPTIGRRVRDAMSSQMLARAVGVKPGVRPSVLDATAGFGKDAYLLASLGCRSLLLERDPVIHALLLDGCQRAMQGGDERGRTAVGRMEVRQADFMDWGPGQDGFDVVYLDPMFPARNKSARAKKEMFVLQQYLGLVQPDRQTGMLRKALEVAGRRVVVKRPRLGEPLDQLSPTYALSGTSSRYDVYVVR